MIDYKTNLLGERTPDELVERSHRHQVSIYALAALLGGAGSVEVVYAFLDGPDAVAVRRFGADDIEPLRDGIRASLASLRAGTLWPGRSALMNRGRRPTGCGTASFWQGIKEGRCAP